MNAGEFCDPAAEVQVPRLGEWLSAVAKTACGLALVVAAGRWSASHPLPAGWIGMTGLVLLLHCGWFHLLSLGWRTCGIAAPPIMNRPLLASSLGDFWGRRWNVAFRDLAMQCVFRPVAACRGPAVGTLAVFAFSGLVHELVISMPVRAGWGGPTAYFLLQGAALLLERSRWGRRWGLRQGLSGRLFAGLVLLAPLPWLFHEAFVRRAIVPTLQWLISL